MGIDNIKFEVQPDYLVVPIPPSNDYDVVSDPQEKKSFNYGFINYGKTFINSYKLDYKIDEMEPAELVGEGQITENDTVFFEIPGFGLGKHFFTSTIILNDTFKFINDTFKLEVHPAVPQFAMKDVDNNLMDLHADLKKGKAVLLDFFASWCGPCKTSTPIINKVWEKYGKGKEKFEIYGLTTYGPDDATVIKGLNWGGKYPKFAYSQRNELFWNIFNDKYGENGIPLFILICPDTLNVSFSPVSWSQIGVPGTLETDLENAVKACVGSPSAVNALEVENLSIYPNPVNDILNISFGRHDRAEDLSPAHRAASTVRGDTRHRARGGAGLWAEVRFAGEIVRDGGSAQLDRRLLQDLLHPSAPPLTLPDSTPGRTFSNRSPSIYWVAHRRLTWVRNPGGISHRPAIRRWFVRCLAWAWAWPAMAAPHRAGGRTGCAILHLPPARRPGSEPSSG